MGTEAFNNDLKSSPNMVTSFITYSRVTPGKGEYGIFECVNGYGGDVRAMVVPVPTKNFAGVYIFKSVYNHVVVGPTNVRQVSIL
jgi:L-2-hydroxyglutarate oxidase LhgO